MNEKTFEILNANIVVEIEEIDMSTQINKSEKVRELLENNVITIEDLYGISSKENLVLKAAKSVALKKSKLFRKVKR